MKILVYLHPTTAAVAIMQYLALEDYNKAENPSYKKKPVNAKNFSRICSLFIKAFGESHNDDIEDALHDKYKAEASAIILKYYNY